MPKAKKDNDVPLTRAIPFAEQYVKQNCNGVRALRPCLRSPGDPGGAD